MNYFEQFVEVNEFGPGALPGNQFNICNDLEVSSTYVVSFGYAMLWRLVTEAQWCVDLKTDSRSKSDVHAIGYVMLCSVLDFGFE